MLVVVFVFCFVFVLFSLGVGVKEYSLAQQIHWFFSPSEVCEKSIQNRLFQDICKTRVQNARVITIRRGMVCEVYFSFSKILFLY